MRAGLVAAWLAGVLLAGGCSVVVTTASVAGSVATTTVSAAGSVTVATVKAGGKIVSSAVNSSGDLAALTIEAAAKLSRAGAVVLVEAGTGAVKELPWQQGMHLGAALQAGRFRGAYQTARIFQGGQVVAAELGTTHAKASDWPLHSGDVVELRR